MPACKCFMALGRCPLDERRAMEKRLLEGVDELYKLNNLDTELASEHDDRIKALEARVATLEGDMHMREAWSDWCLEHIKALEAGGPEQAARTCDQGPDASCDGCPHWVERGHKIWGCALERQAATPAQQPRSCEHEWEPWSEYAPTLLWCPLCGATKGGTFAQQPREGGGA